MEVFVDLLIGVLGGGLCSWLIAHVYYRQANKDQNAVFNRLSLDVRKAGVRAQRDAVKLRGSRHPHPTPPVHPFDAVLRT